LGRKTLKMLRCVHIPASDARRCVQRSKEEI